MYRQWVEASQLARHDASDDAWSVDYSGHPLLDPAFIQRPTRVGRFFRMMYNRIRHDDVAYTHEVARMLGGEKITQKTVAHAKEMIRRGTEV